MKSVLALLVFGLLVFAGCGDDSHSQTAAAPSGEDCAENIAYLQAGVDAYRAATGTEPSAVNELLTAVDGHGPFVESVPACPAGNAYVIEGGVVREAPRG